MAFEYHLPAYNMANKSQFDFGEVCGEGEGGERREREENSFFIFQF